MSRRAHLKSLIAGAAVCLMIGGTAVDPVVAFAADEDAEVVNSFCVAWAHKQGSPLPDLADACYPNLAEALQGIYPEADVPADIDVNALTVQMLDTLAGTADQSVLSIEFWNRNYNANPNRAAIYAAEDDPNGCRGGDTYQVANVGPIHNDKFSSAKNYSGCNVVQHWEHASWSGANQDCSPCAYIGDAMNNRTTSIRWHQ